MSGPLIAVCRLITLFVISVCLHLLINRSPPPSAVLFIFIMAIIVVRLWVIAERRRADYLHERELEIIEKIEKSKASKDTTQPEREKIVERHHYIEKDKRNPIIVIIIIIAALCTILGFIINFIRQNQ